MIIVSQDKTRIYNFINIAVIGAVKNKIMIRC